MSRRGGLFLLFIQFVFCIFCLCLLNVWARLAMQNYSKHFALPQCHRVGSSCQRQQHQKVLQFFSIFFFFKFRKWINEYTKLNKLPTAASSSWSALDQAQKWLNWSARVFNFIQLGTFEDSPASCLWREPSLMYSTYDSHESSWKCIMNILMMSIHTQAGVCAIALRVLQMGEYLGDSFRSISRQIKAKICVIRMARDTQDHKRHLGWWLNLYLYLLYIYTYVSCT